MNHDELQHKINLIPLQNTAALREILSIANGPDHAPFGASRIYLSVFNPGLGYRQDVVVDPNKLARISRLVAKVILGIDQYDQWFDKRTITLPTFNSLTHPMAITALQQIESLALIVDVIWSMHYNNGSGSWYFTLSGGGIEDWVGKDYSLSTAMECALEHLYAFYHATVIASDSSSA